MGDAEIDIEVDASGLEVLVPDECMALVRQGSVGRVVFTSAALPAVLPVNYVVDDDGAILLRTGSQTRLASAAGAVVAFEVDDISMTSGSWSVVVTGRVTVVRDPDARARIDALGLRPWVRSRRDLALRIAPELVTGRRLPTEPALLDPLEGAGLQAG
ncbi:MAG: pyridoxamine 5'-phosphate oxidase family protein [Frankiaceae bacterium]